MTDIVRKLIADPKADHCKLVKYLMKTQMVDMAYVDRNGDNLLIHAAKSNKPLIIRVLLNSGDDANHVNTTTYRDSALSWSVFKGHIQCTRILIEFGSDINHQTACDGNTLLMWAYKQGNILDFKHILYKGHDLRLTNRKGQDIIEMCEPTYEYHFVLRDYLLTIKNVVNIFFHRYNKPFEYSLIDYVLEFF